ncbi:MAG TPA: hypothetical protein VNQ97_13335 [Burkholderiaceae bacterium]|nr:hypothetical protein [Burkholderiaceae bacterium]
MTNNKRSARGRPALPDEEKRDQLIQFRCSAGEKAGIEDAAAKSGKHLSDWLRDLAIRAARRLK